MISDQILTLSAQLGELLVGRGWQITCAESCTGGGIGYAITSAPGSSNWFQRGFIIYSNQAKSDLVAVKSETLIAHGAVSEQVVQEMAKGAAEMAGAEVSVAVSGVAGPGGGSAEKPVGLVWFGIVVGDRKMNFQKVLPGDRAQIREQTVVTALTVLIELLNE
ncbi:CinA family protein [Planctobacterium marinum]|uniref:CinA family protein n=1 Tax=Planctobacterium marinum TaxID=1631968 RepID=UPI0030C6DF35